MSQTAYPLAWPDGWPRTPPQKRKDYKFYGGSTTDFQGGQEVYVGRKPVSFERARKLLVEELARLKAKNVVLSTNVPLRNDGLPRAEAARMVIRDPGVAVYFTLSGKPLSMARDAFLRIEQNMRSLGLAIAAIRQLERHGGSSMMERAFTGFLAITPPSWKKPWREVFGVAPDWRGDLKSRYRELCKITHPDAGGADSVMGELNVAYEEARAELGQ